MLDPTLLLLQITDSALPIGSYSHSWGLETAVQAGRIRDAEQVYDYLSGLLRLSLASQEGRACARAFDCSREADIGALSTLQDQLSAMRWAVEPRRASLDLGKRLRQLAKRAWGVSCPAEAAHHSLAFGWVCAQAGLGREETVLAYLFASLTGLVSAAVRLVPLGHTDGQIVLARLHAQVRLVLPSCLTGSDLSGFAPLQERDCQMHQTLYSRLFQS